jgi:glutathione-regulated potassium-efflux system ancillary protein KefF
MDSQNPPQSDSIYVIAAHPDWRNSKINRRLFAQAQTANPRVVVNDLYGSYPDYFIDIATEQRRLAAAKLVVLLHPIHWYSMPALQKLWLDEVLTFGWAYGRPEGQPSALHGKDLWLVATTGGSESAYHPQGYNRYFFDAFLPPYEQTATLCGMRFLPPLLLHGAHARPEAEVDAHIAVFGARLQSYPHWPELDDLDACPTCIVPTTERPPETALSASSASS